ncbi:MAG: tetratricopeptide repeat protein [Saprospiraceae bacterium]|nr:tetratricopeptide repeat protein [Saprospiraceae bacterium]
MKKHPFLLLYTLVLALLLNSCASPNKKKEDVGFVGRAYQNLTAYYNGYFNANELLTAAILEIEAKHPDNFQEQLVIYPYLLDQDTTTASAALNTAIDKLKKDIYLHQASHWVDDSYFQMGKAQFLKKNYEKAENTFKYVVQNYSEAQLALAKKKRMSPKQKRKELEKTRNEIRKEKEAEKEKKAEKKEEIAKAKAKAKKEKAKAKKKAAKEKKKAKAKAAKAKKKGKSVPKSKTSTSKTSDNKSSVQTPSQPNVDTKASENKEDAKESTPKPPAPPKKYFLKHRPVYQEAKLWLAKTYIQRSNYEDGDRILRSFLSESGTFDFVRREALLTMAYSEMRREKYNSAIEPLTKAIPMVKEKKRRARLSYILGQLYMKSGNYEMAYNAFSQVEKLKPSYEMTFNATLSKYSCSLATNKMTDDELNSRLNKMLKDLKNEEYKDQIYFMLADINLRNNDIASAIKNLQTGIGVSKKGPEAKAESYLKLADIFYKKDAFDKAYHYYDSTATAYPNTKERYKEILFRRDALKDIAYNLEIISYQDSLLMVSKMSPEEQEALAKKLLKAAKEKERIAASSGTAASTAQNFNFKGGSNGLPSSSFGGPVNNSGFSSRPAPSTFFAYNDKSLKDGKKQFEKTWGKRPLEDNWRYASMIQNFAGSSDNPEDEGIGAFFISKSEIAKVLEDVPNDPATVAKAESAILDAMSALGSLYPDKIERYDLAIEILEKMIARYPNNVHEPQALYQLYFAYMLKGDPAKANSYADLLKSKYNGNPYSLYFSDPEHVKNMMSKEQQLNQYYHTTYESLEHGDYATAYDMSFKSDSIFGNKNTLRPKFAMIAAMSLGNLKGKEAYIAALKDLVAVHPNTEEEKRAKEMLRLLGSGANEAEKLLSDAEKIYKATDNDQHFVMILFKPEVKKIEEAKTQLADYNTRFFNKSDLRTANITLRDGTTDRQVLLIRSFDNKLKAMEYYNQAKNKKGDFISARFPFDIYAISNANYRELIRLKSATLYDAWFNKYYKME